MNKNLRVLIVEDSENDALLLLRRLRRDGIEPEFDRVDTPQAMIAALAKHSWDVVISDYAMPRFGGLDALAVLKQTGLDIPFILVSGTIGEEMAVEAMKAGANDYVMKGKLQRLTTAIARELREVEIRKEHKQAQDWQRYLAQYDVLTDLPNRNLLYERLEEAVNSHCRDGKSLALMLMDLNDFKEINDTMGHQTGDLLLQEVGRRLQSTIHKNETVARLGGDEFGILLPEMAEEQAIPAADKLLKALEPPFAIGDLAVDVRASIGIAIFPKHGEDKDTLFRRADVAMYQAKRSTDGYVMYSPEHDPYSPKRLSVMAELHRTIKKKELFLVYQPKVNLVTGKITGVESLARWQHPRFGFIPPDQFIPLAERTGFIKPLTAWGLETALGQSRAWLQQVLRVPVSVNVSARILRDEDFPNRVGQLLEGMAIKASHLELEVTESVIMEDPAHALKILTEINHMGVALSIDDFGTGYSSLSYLKKLPVHAVKIDKSFILHMTEDQNDAQIVRSTIDLAHNLGMKVIAEGVENREIWECLLTLGCDEVQGYYLTRPLPAPEMTTWLCESQWAMATANLKAETAEKAFDLKSW
jgi:diguanylate cyclase (GGDEF)-like protein